MFQTMWYLIVGAWAEMKIPRSVIFIVIALIGACAWGVAKADIVVHPPHGQTMTLELEMAQEEFSYRASMSALRTIVEFRTQAEADVRDIDTKLGSKSLRQVERKELKKDREELLLYIESCKRVEIVLETNLDRSFAKMENIRRQMIEAGLTPNPNMEF